MLSATFIEWIKSNLPMAIGIAAAIVLVVVVIIALAVSAYKKKRADAAEDSGDIPEDEEENESIGFSSESDSEIPTPNGSDKSADEGPATVPATEPAPEDLESAPEHIEEREEVAEQSDVKKKEQPASVKARKPVGRWTIEKKDEGEYIAKLNASNGEVMLSSEIYSSEDGARSGISTIVKCVENGQFVTYRDKSGNYYYKLKTANNRLLCVGEIYRAKDQCERAVETVKRIASTAVVSDELIEGEKYIKYVPQRTSDGVRTARGKWRVEKTEEGKYRAKLFASNGQLMLATEEVSTRKGAENSILAVKRNAAEGNFVIDRDKFGRYYYKLRNSSKSVICIGEAYESPDSCMKAIESVRRFAATAVTSVE